MAFTVQTSIEIDAAPEAVWEVLSQPRRWATWNKVLLGLDGPLEEGKRHRLSIVLLPKRAVPIPVKLESFDGSALIWGGGVPFIFTARHGFQLEPLDGGERTRVDHFETFTGLYSIPLKPLAARQLERSYDAVNRALKRAVEEA